MPSSERPMDPCESELLRQLKHCCGRAPLEGKQKVGALLAVLFGLLERREANPAATASTFGSMWNESFASEMLSDPVSATDMLVASLSAIYLAPQPSAEHKIRALVSSACQLVKHSDLNGTEFVELFLTIWRRFMSETPLGGLSDLTLAAGRARARELEKMVAGWTELSPTGVVGLLTSAVCLAAKRSRVTRPMIHRLVDDAWDGARAPEAAS